MFTENEAQSLKELSNRISKSVDNIIREAITTVISENRGINTGSSLRTARGIWKDRNDLPEFRKREGTS
jgi:hypothetical protein